MDFFGLQPRRSVRTSTSAGRLVLGLSLGCVFLGVGCKKKPAPTEGTLPSAQVGSGNQPGSLADRLNAVETGQADKAAGATLPVWKTYTGSAALEIPLVKGLTVVSVASDPQGDYESIGTVEDISPIAMRMRMNGDRPAPKFTGLLAKPSDLGQADPKLEFPDHVKCLRLVDVADIAKAHSYSQLFCESSVEHFAGSTALGASTEVLNQLRAGQQAEFYLAPANKWAALEQKGPQHEGGQSGQPTLSTHAGQPMYTCNLNRVGTTDVAFPVMVNDKPVELPALHAMCAMDDGEETHVYFLDQPSNPLTLALLLGPAGQAVQVTRITLPSADEQKAAAAPGASAPATGGGNPEMEQALASKKPLDLYGITFDFNNAGIKPESDGVLKQIADILQKNPDWKLSVSGYTDNLGDGNFNLGLSQRRAAAVKDALVTRYKIAPERLTTTGYGASQPVGDNKTLDGRARNRRVQMQRQ